MLPDMTAAPMPIAMLHDRSPRDSFWISLGYFNFYRFIVACAGLLAVTHFSGLLSLAPVSPVFAIWVTSIYIALSAAFHVFLRFRQHFDIQLSVHVITDILALVLLMTDTGGIGGGLGIILLTSIAGAAVVGQGRLTLFYAALASIALLLEESYHFLKPGLPEANFFQAALLCTGYFVTAITMRALAKRIITNERLARQRGIDLANQLQINQKVIEDMPDGVIVVDRAGAIKQFNPQAVALLGAALSSHSSLADVSQSLSDFLPRSLSPVANVPFVAVRAGGREMHARFVEVGPGSDFQVIFLEDLSELQARARQMKLAALGRLTANIAHEIRNPLSAISHAAELLQEEVIDKSSVTSGVTVARLTHIIVENTQRLDRMVQQVLRLNRRDLVTPANIGIADFLARFVREFSEIEKISSEVFALDCPRDIEIVFDRSHLNQVMWNLCRNALHYCSRGKGSIRVSVVHRENEVVIDVEDDGAGVSIASRAHLFEPFFTTSAGGTGLGLYIAREVCAANGATLDYVESEGGAHFRIICKEA